MVSEQSAPRSRGELEAAIGRTVIQFEKDLTGRGPLEVRAYLLHDLVVVRLRGGLSVAEQRLAARDDPRARQLIKEMRRELVMSARDRIQREVGDIVRAGVRSLYSDISTKTGERVLVFQLAAVT